MSSWVLGVACHQKFPDYSTGLLGKRRGGLSKIKTAGYIQALAEKHAAACGILGG